MIYRVLPAIAALLALIATSAFAHPGGLAADGCHNDRKNGGRHCHGNKAAPVQQAGAGVYYPNCSAARAAGAVPIRIGSPG